MFQIVILICAMTVQRADCRPESALDVIRGPEVANEMMCGFHGQAFLASTSLPPRPGREYMKIQCVKDPNDREARLRDPFGAAEQPQWMHGAIRD